MTCKHCGQPSPEEFYKNAMELGDEKLFSIFGRTAKQILRALHFYDMRTLTDYQEPKMTRVEAIIKLLNVGISEYAPVLSSLEALGLLKFEELSKRSEKGVKFKGANGVVYTVHDEMIYDPHCQCLIEIGKFTYITMDNGSFIQGKLKAISQD